MKSTVSYIRKFEPVPDNQSSGFLTSFDTNQPVHSQKMPIKA